VILKGAKRSEESLYGSRNEILRLHIRVTVHVFNKALKAFSFCLLFQTLIMDMDVRHGRTSYRRFDQ
ncbi:MAG: hypothetical protein WAV28_18235, partial [Sedimentisphaerales bacterium]